MKPGWLSSEFFVALAALATKVVTLLLVLNLIHSTDPDKLSQSISAVILGVGGLFATSATSANYGNNRTKLKMEALKETTPPVTPAAASMILAK